MIKSGKDIKDRVKVFYEEEGWCHSDNGVYVDTLQFEDLRPVTYQYRSNCMMRVKRHLKSEGKILLDIGSGAFPYQEYRQYSEGYQFHLCGDVSHKALLEARKNLGLKGLFVQCDITYLPFRSNSFDGFVSLHTIYHVPAEEQIRAFKELHRVLCNASSGVIVYSWGKYSPLMILLTPQIYLKKAVIRLMRLIYKDRAGGEPQNLYFFSHGFRYLNQNLSPAMKFRLLVWRCVSVSFLKLYVHEHLWGEKILSLIYLIEEKFPHFMGRVGEYPMFVIEK